MAAEKEGSDSRSAAQAAAPARSPRPLLASPIRLANLQIPNRVAMSAMSSVLGNEDGTVTPEIIAYYEARAKGGTGLIIVEFTGVWSKYGRAEPKQLLLDDDCFIGGHRRIVSSIQAHGMRAAIQLHAPGQFAHKHTLQGLPVGPSAVFSRRDSAKQLCRAMEHEEILAMIAHYGAAAERAVAAGYEAIELHAAHGYLPMAFLSPARNQRDDAWGGDQTRRMRFAIEVVRAIKQALGPDRPLIYRLSSAEFVPGGLTLEDMLQIIPHLVAAGADAIHVSSGSIDGSLDRAVDPMSMPEGWRLEHCRAIRAVTAAPLMAVGPFRWPDAAEAALKAGDLDMIALGRPLLADPDWTRRAIAGEAIRPCTNCNWCFERVLRHESIACAENPRAGRELHAPALVGGAGRGAIVIGGGPGGMAAALDFAEAGYRTELYEARRTLGGGLIASATPPHKDKLFWYLDHLSQRIATSAVKVHIDATIDAEAIVAKRPDAVVLATGARALEFDIDGFDRPNVISAYDLLMDDVPLPPPNASPIVVYGGGETGCETAEFLAERGYSVILVTRSPARALARSAETMYRKHLIVRLSANPNVQILENTQIRAVDESGVRIQDESGERELTAWGVVLAQGRQPGIALAEKLAAAHIPFALVGDVERVGRIGDAVHAARAAVLELTARIGAKPGPSND